MGLLDGFLGQGWEDPKSQAVMALAGGLLQGNFGRGATGYADVLAGAKDKELKRKFLEMQMQGMQSDMEMKGDAAARAKQLRELAGRFQTPATQGRGATGAINSLLPPELQMVAQPAIPGQPAGFDYQGYAKALAGIDPIAALELEQRISPKRKLMRLGAGDTLVDEADPSKPLFSAPTAPEKDPEIIRQLKIIYGEGTPAYQNALHRLGAKATSHQPGVSVTYGAPVAGVDGSGNPVFFQPSKDGSAPSIISGVAPPPPKMGEKQVNQVVGIDGLGSAIDSYTTALDSWSPADAINPNKRAQMGTLYNNMMLQAKEAYNLGVLNGPDLQILQSVVRDPASLMGMVTSNSEMKRQATTLKREMNKIKAQITKKPGNQEPKNIVVDY